MGMITNKEVLVLENFGEISEVEIRKNLTIGNGDAWLV